MGLSPSPKAVLKPLLLIASACLFLGTFASTAHAAVSAGEAKAIAIDAYIYGYSLITTEVTRVQMTNVPKVEELHAPLNAFANVRRYPPADYRGVSAPNADTLYSMGWLDLKEPIVFSHPDMGKRFYLFEVLDLWMRLLPDSPSSRTANGKAANYLFTGPGWNGTVPAGMKHLPMRTRYIGILGRTYADGSEADYKAVNKLQSQYKLTPLSAWGKSYKYKAPPVNENPAFSMTEKPQQVILDLGTENYFNMLARLMAGPAPPAKEDAPILERMAKIGIEPGKKFNISALDAETRAALKDVPKLALEKIEANKPSVGKVVNNWIVTKGLGMYGTDYIKRAVVAAFGWPANVEKDAVYPNTAVDADGNTLNGAHKYKLTFAKGETPPVNAFWSITMYEIDQGWWFVPNKLNKFTVSPRNDLVHNKDGSTTLYFQHESPGKDKQNNWLPAPKGDFILMLRMYWPKENSPSILNGTWHPPKVEKVE
jgi:hypothetical protein